MKKTLALVLAMVMCSAMTHQALTQLNTETVKAEGVLAESWKDVNGDGMIWEFKLKENVRFQRFDED